MRPPSITCPKCGRTSFNPNDVLERYCGFCHVFLKDIEVRRQVVSLSIEDEPKLVVWNLSCGHKVPLDFENTMSPSVVPPTLVCPECTKGLRAEP